MTLRTVENQQLALNAVEVLRRDAEHDKDSVKALQKIKRAVDAALEEVVE